MAIGAFIGAVISATISIVDQAQSGEGIDIGVVVINAAAGALSGALAASGAGLIASVAGNSVISAATYIGEQSVKGETVNPEVLLLTTAAGGVSGAIGGKGANGARLIGVNKTAKRVLKTTVSPKKIAMYSAKKLSIRRTVVESGMRYLSGVASYRKMNQFIGAAYE